MACIPPQTIGCADIKPIVGPVVNIAPRTKGNPEGRTGPYGRWVDVVARVHTWYNWGRS